MIMCNALLIINLLKIGMFNVRFYFQWYHSKYAFVLLYLFFMFHFVSNQCLSVVKSCLQLSLREVTYVTCFLCVT